MFKNSKDYWEKRYAIGDNSGSGSYGVLAELKADTINKIIDDKKIKSVSEFGCGDGNQLSLLEIKSYIGYDVSDTIIKKCINIFSDDNTKQFKNVRDYNNEKFDLSMSLDVIYHVVEDNLFEEYMNTLFNSSEKYVLIYSSDFDDKGYSHVKHRKFTKWVENNITNFSLIKKIINKYPEKSSADFYFYEKLTNL